MSAPKKWLGFAALGAAVAALIKGIRHRDDKGVPPPKEAGPVDASQ